MKSDVIRKRSRYDARRPSINGREDTPSAASPSPSRVLADAPRQFLRLLLWIPLYSCPIISKILILSVPFPLPLNSWARLVRYPLVAPSVT